MTSSNGNIFRVTGPLCGEFTGPGEFPTKRPVTRSFDVFFDLRLNKRLSKQPWGWWFELPSWSLWCQCNVISILWSFTDFISLYFRFTKYLICHVFLGRYDDFLDTINSNLIYYAVHYNFQISIVYWPRYICRKLMCWTVCVCFYVTSVLVRNVFHRVFPFIIPRIIHLYYPYLVMRIHIYVYQSICKHSNMQATTY